MRQPTTLLATIITLLAFFLPTPQALADQLLYLSAGNVINVFKIDPQTGALNSLQKIDLPGAGPTTLSPDKKFLYAVAQGPTSKQSTNIVTFQVLKDGALNQLNAAPANLRPGYLAVDATGNFLTGNHYGPGKVTLWALTNGIYKGKTVQELELEPKAHSTVFSPGNKFLLVPATGPNKVFVNKFNNTNGKLTPHSPAHANGPQPETAAQQPRHLIFHPNNKTVYTTLERENAGVGVWQWDSTKGSLKIVQNIVTEPDNFQGQITTADLHLTPNSKFLYISSRDSTTRGAPTGHDTIVGFKVSPRDQSLTLISHTPAPRVPRSFAISPDGKFLYAAGQGDAQLAAYRINKNSGQLKNLKHYPTGENPIWVETVELP